MKKIHYILILLAAAAAGVFFYFKNKKNNPVPAVSQNNLDMIGGMVQNGNLPLDQINPGVLMGGIKHPPELEDNYNNQVNFPDAVIHPIKIKGGNNEEQSPPILWNPPQLDDQGGDAPPMNEGGGFFLPDEPFKLGGNQPFLPQ